MSKNHQNSIRAPDRAKLRRGMSAPPGWTMMDKPTLPEWGQTSMEPLGFSMVFHRYQWGLPGILQIPQNMMGLYGWKILNPRKIGPKMEDDMMTGGTPIFSESPQLHSSGSKIGVLGNQGGQPRWLRPVGGKWWFLASPDASKSQRSMQKSMRSGEMSDSSREMTLFRRNVWFPTGFVCIRHVMSCLKMFQSKSQDCRRVDVDGCRCRVDVEFSCQAQDQCGQDRQHDVPAAWPNYSSARVHPKKIPNRGWTHWVHHPTWEDEKRCKTRPKNANTVFTGCFFWDGPKNYDMNQIGDRSEWSLGHGSDSQSLGFANHLRA